MSYLLKTVYAVRLGKDYFPILRTYALTMTLWYFSCHSCHIPVNAEKDLGTGAWNCLDFIAFLPKSILGSVYSVWNWDLAGEVPLSDHIMAGWWLTTHMSILLALCTSFRFFGGCRVGSVFGCLFSYWKYSKMFWTCTFMIRTYKCVNRITAS